MNSTSPSRDLPYSRMVERLLQPDQDVWSIHYAAAARAEAGEDVLLMSVGDPDFQTPEDIIETLVRQIRKGRTHYSPAAGEYVLRRAIADLETQASGRAMTPENFVILPGATAAVYAALASICDAGDEVIIPEPMYIGYHGIISALGLKVISVPLDLYDDCALPVQALLDSITPRTRAVLLNTPGNPFGNIIPASVLRPLAAQLRERGIWLISDEVYSLFTFDAPHESLLKCAESLDNVIVVDGLSKSHAMTGWRIGWVASPPAMTAAITAYAGAAFFGCSQFIQDAAAYALANDGPHVDRMCEAYRERRDLVLRRLENIQLLDCVVPKAGMFLMLDVSRCGGGEQFARGLLDAQGVSTIPGVGFGANSAGFVRLSLTHPLDVVAQAMDRIEAYVDTLI